MLVEVTHCCEFGRGMSPWHRKKAGRAARPYPGTVIQIFSSAQARYPQAAQENNMHRNIGLLTNLAIGVRAWASAWLLGSSLRMIAFPEAELAGARQRFGMLPLQEINELFTHLAAQVECLPRRACTQQATQIPKQRKKTICTAT